VFGYSKQRGLSCFRSFFRRQCFPKAFVAAASHCESDAHATISAAAKYFGAFGAGFPNGTSNFAATNSATSCS
jgi:hypothetical protein